MKKGPSQSGTNSSKDLKCGERYPSFNWSEHADAHNSFSCQQNFLNANFLFSLPTQKPREGTVNARSMVSAIVDIQSLQSPQIKRAWETLSCLQGTGRNYLKPGISKLAVQNGDSEFSRSTTSYSSVETRRKTTLWSSSEKTQTSFEGSRNGNFGRDPNVTCSIARASNSTITNGNFLSQSRTSAPEDDRSTIVGGPDQRNRSMLYTSPVHAGNGNFNAHADHKEVFVESCLDDIDEDDVLQNIDVDQIVLEHFQSASTPQSSRSKLPPVTPAIEIDNTTGPDEASLPPELLTICSHGLMLALCQDSAIHLQEKKDTLIAISNELLDGIDNLNQMQIAKLRKDRLELNKQVQQLEKHLHSSAMDEERKVSHFSASTTASRRFQFEASSASASRIDPVRFDAQVHLHNEPGSFYKVPSPPSVSFTSLDNFHVPQGSVEREVYIPKPGNIDYIEGSNDRRWSGHDFPWTKKLEANNRKVFGNHSFRPNQREVINATMSKCDVFVLMPTGGGKSLTYQLPALICNGVTLVVCPLVSLIQDQIMHLLQANIPAAYLSANMEWSEQQDIFRELSSAHCKFKLLYVTPEKVAKSDVLLRQLESLHARDSLSRIVIDEAHCVSQWGHDFRPDYQGLGILKQKFPDTPVLALTATATADVKDDVVRALGLEKCIIFRQSFNRPNLWYSVIAKTKTCLDDIHKFIKQNHDAECGIIYCLSRMDCEKVAEKLQECGHKATFYHGSMEPQQRAFVQKQWSKDEVDIICATVAFGMGINKPDVRFVIHHSLPKSIEGYHQECGRAGRDGQRSSCVLYYSYSDYIRMKHMITQGALEQSSSTYAAKRPSVLNSDRLAETNVENLLRMVSYCENDTDCRRHLQLVHFGEKFDSANCQKTCDNCSRTSDYIEKDVTDTARQLVELVKSTGKHYSSNHILEVYRGSMSQMVKKYRHDILSLHGAGKHLGKAEVLRILRHLVTQDFLFEEVKKSDLYGNISSVLKVNESKACILCFGGHKINIRFPASTKSVKLNKSEAKVAKASLFSGKFDYPASSPAQVQSGGDVDLQAHLFAALRLLRTVLLKEAGEGVMAYHIFGNAVLQQISKTIPRTKEQLLDVNGIGKAKVKKYGDRVLETIESTINEFKKANKSNSSGNDSSEGAKRRRQATGVKSCESKDDEDFIEISALSKKRATDTNVNQNCGMSEYDEQLVHNIDWSDSDNDMDTNCPNANTGKTGGRVLPSWSVPANKARN